MQAPECLLIKLSKLLRTVVKGGPGYGWEVFKPGGSPSIHEVLNHCACQNWNKQVELSPDGLFRLYSTDWRLEVAGYKKADRSHKEGT
jgi:hypothetical protein